MRKNYGITTKEKKKMMIYVSMIVLGTIFVNSIRELFLNKILESYPPGVLLLISGGALVGFYYMVDLD